MKMSLSRKTVVVDRPTFSFPVRMQAVGASLPGRRLGTPARPLCNTKAGRAKVPILRVSHVLPLAFVPCSEAPLP